MVPVPASTGPPGYDVGLRFQGAHVSKEPRHGKDGPQTQCHRIAYYPDSRAEYLTKYQITQESELQLYTKFSRLYHGIQLHICNKSCCVLAGI
jgi:hypothetical protein